MGDRHCLPDLGATLPALTVGALCYFALVSRRRQAFAS
jgi:nucleobase:cation symporter-1, NCS1 family